MLAGDVHVVAVSNYLLMHVGHLYVNISMTLFSIISCYILPVSMLIHVLSISLQYSVYSYLFHAMLSYGS